MAPVSVGPCSIQRRIVAVRRKKGDAAGVVLGLAEAVLHLPREVLAGLALECDLEGIALLIARRLNIADLPERGIWDLGVSRRKRRVCVG